jgi:GrpB-like predicted nucleotidyltransferase (UPF0157 family)
MKANDEALPRIEVVPYDRNWPVMYQAEQRSLRACLSSLISCIEHIGSTAVPNLQAKPIIDMMASSERPQEAQLFALKLASIGYVLVETGMRNRLLFRRIAEPSGQMYHLHIVGVETWAGRKERIIRDYLISHPVAAASYGLLKIGLAASHCEDSLAYTKAKTGFIQNVMDKACNELGLARIDVWTDQQ